MAYFTDSFMEHRRKKWLRSIHAVEVLRADTNTWYRGEIGSKKIEGDTLVIMATFPALDSVQCKITASRLIDIRGEVAAYQQREISKVEGQGTLLKITIPIYEVQS